MDHRFDYFKKVFYKPFVEVTKIDEGLYFFQINKCDLIDNDLNLRRIHS